MAQANESPLHGASSKCTLLEFFEKVQDSPIFILSSSIGLLWTLARDFFKTRTKNTLRLAGLKAKVHTFMLYGMW